MVQNDTRNDCHMFDNSWQTAEECEETLLNLSYVSQSDSLTQLICHTQLDLDLEGGGDVSISL